jgi:hypothetical protein
VTEWRKSSRSQGGSECVELRVTNGDAGIRDTKNTGAGQLHFTRRTFVAFLQAATTGQITR